MADVQPINDWRMPATATTAYERLLVALGTEDFGATVRDCIQQQTAGARRVFLFEASDRAHSTLQYCSVEPALGPLLPAYVERFLPIDPVWQAYGAAPSERDMALLRVRPADIASASFRRQFFDQPGIVERVSVIQRGRNEWRVLNVSRHHSHGFFSDTELQALVGLASLALPMLPHNRASRVTTPQLTVAQLEERFASRFGTLTQREREVCARAAIGMSVEATALDLRIAKTSVLTYRRRAYQRLSVTSPYELCSLVTH